MRHLPGKLMIDEPFKLSIYLQLASSHILLETWSILCID